MIYDPKLWFNLICYLIIAGGSILVIDWIYRKVTGKSKLDISNLYIKED
jgi:hypothetical protein